MNQKIKHYIPEEAHQRAQHQHLLEKEQADKDAKKNHNFIQIEKRSLKDLRGLIGRNSTAARLLMILAEKMNRQNALICSFKTLGEITGLGRTTLSNAVKQLREECWIEVIKVGTANAYRVNSRAFWQSQGNLKHTSFNATIIASSSEQDSEAWDNVDLRYFPLLSVDEIESTTDNTEKDNGKDPRQIDLLSESE